MKNLMASFEAVAGNELGNNSSRDEPVQNSDAMRKPRILLAATGSVVVLKFVNLCQIFSRWVAVKAVATRVSLCFIDQASLPNDVSDLYQAVLDIWPEIESIFSFKPTSAVRSLAVNSNLMRGNNINSINKS
ncbi:hypothetical protein ACFXTN_018877 [Malus domestica]